MSHSTSVHGGTRALSRIREAAELAKSGVPVDFRISGPEESSVLAWRAGNREGLVVSGTRYALRQVLPGVKALHRMMSTVQ